MPSANMINFKMSQLQHFLSNFHNFLPHFVCDILFPVKFCNYTPATLSVKGVYRNQRDVGRAVGRSGGRAVGRSVGRAVGRSVAKSCVANSSYSFEAILMKLMVNDDIEV